MQIGMVLICVLRYIKHLKTCTTTTLGICMSSETISDKHSQVALMKESSKESDYIDATFINVGKTLGMARHSQ